MSHFALLLLHCSTYTVRRMHGNFVFYKISRKANAFFLSLSHKTSSFNGSVFFLRYSQAPQVLFLSQIFPFYSI